MIKSKFNIPIAKVDLTENDINSVLKPLSNGWLVQGPMVSNFENIWSDFVGVKHSIAVTSCTSAMMLALIALGFKKGDEVIVPALTWISTANVVEQLGGKVIFCDIDINTFNIDINKIESLITPKTKYIMPVHLFGLPADIKKINKIAKQHNLKVIEDAACGFGSKINNVHVGATGNIACFSFHPRKSITTGEGGMLTTNNPKYANWLKMFKSFGIKKRKNSQFEIIGSNLKMSNINAVFGITQIKIYKKILERKRKLAFRYIEKLSKNKNIIFQKNTENSVHSFQTFCITVENRNNLMTKLKKKGIETQIGYYALSEQNAFKNQNVFLSDNLKNSKFLAKSTLALPLFYELSFKQQDYVINNILKLT